MWLEVEITVTILLAVYNGEKYLDEQIKSLLNQTVNDIKVIIRDDGSTDNSARIIESYCKLYPDKVFCISGEATGSAKKNFAKLLECTDDDYIMFCDQDDIWLPSKIELTLEAMKKAEGDQVQIPVLVHTDLQVVDSNLNVISNSFFKYQQRKPQNITLAQLLVENCVTGCTVMINRALKNRCAEIPDECLMHDWWLALVATLFGKVVCIEQPTIMYRQHNDNQVGANTAYGLGYLGRKLYNIKKVRKIYNDTYAQAQALIERYDDELGDQQLNLLKTYCGMQYVSKCKKIKTINKYGFKKATRLRVIGQYILI